MFVAYHVAHSFSLKTLKQSASDAGAPIPLA